MTHLQLQALRDQLETAIARSTTTIIQIGTSWDGVVFERGRLDSLNMIKHWIGRLGMGKKKQE